VAIVIKMTGPPKLCKTDEIGEICLYAQSTASAYWGLEGKSASTFRVRDLITTFWNYAFANRWTRWAVTIGDWESCRMCAVDLLASSDP
jgi:hypothetical protein